MPFLFNPAPHARLIEYLRADLDPARYNPYEINHLADTRAGGKFWATLGIGMPTLPQLRQLVRGTNPVSGERLGSRREKPDSQKKNVSFYSAVFNVPKSVSVASEIGGDHRIRKIMHEAASKTMELIESELVGLRPRKKGAPDRNKCRNTRSMAWVSYIGNESRYLDPHLHVHCDILNATFDSTDPKRPIKALDATRVFSNQKNLTNIFNAFLREGLEKAGYATVDNPESGSFEIAGISREVCLRLSKANRAIKSGSKTLLMEATQRKGAELEPQEIAAIEAKHARKIRPKKSKYLQVQLHDSWVAQVAPLEFEAISAVVRTAIERSLPPTKPSRGSPDPVAQITVTQTSGPTKAGQANSVPPTNAASDCIRAITPPSLEEELAQAADNLAKPDAPEYLHP